MTTAKPGTWKSDTGDGYFGSPLRGLSEKIRHHAGEFRERALFIGARARNSARRTPPPTLPGSTLQRA